MDCHTRHDIEITHGDSFELYVGLARGWEHVDLRPGDYQGRLVFREAQEDDYPELYQVVSPPIAATDHRFPDMDWILHFAMGPSQTQALPDYAEVCFCELRSVDSSYVRRLFNGRVKHRD